MSGRCFVTRFCCESYRERFVGVNAGQSHQGVRRMVEFEGDELLCR